MKKVLLIGIETEVGGAIPKYMDYSGYEWHIVYHPNAKPNDILNNEKKIIWHFHDLNEVYGNIELFSEFDIIIHTGIPGIFEDWHEHSQFVQDDQLTAHVVNMAIEAKVKKMIFLSSASVLKSLTHKDIIDEQSDFNSKPLTPRLRQIFQGEQELWRAWAEGLKVTILHSGIVVNRSNEGRLNHWIKLMNGIPTANFGRNGFIELNKIAQSVVRATDELYDNNRYICIEHNSTFKEILDNEEFESLRFNRRAKEPGIYLKLKQVIKSMLVKLHLYKEEDDIKFMKADFKFSNQLYREKFVE